MARAVKLMVLEDTSTAQHDESEKVVLVSKQKRPLEKMIAGEPSRWDVSIMDESDASTLSEVVETTALMSHLRTLDADTVVVSVSDSRQLVGLMLQPQLPINLSESVVEYYDWITFLEHIFDGFLRDTHWPAPKQNSP